MKRFAKPLLIFLLLAVVCAFSFAGTYSWTDEYGYRHTSDSPPSRSLQDNAKATPEPYPFPIKQDMPTTDALVLPSAKPDYRILLQKVEKMEKKKIQEKSQTQPNAAIHHTETLQKPDKHRIPEYKRRIEQLEKLIVSRERLVAEDARTIGRLQQKITALTNKSAFLADEEKRSLENAQKDLRFARMQLQEDEMDLNTIKDNLEALKFKLETATTRK
jgi:hypothetical protein